MSYKWHFVNLHNKEEGAQIFCFDSYVAHLLTCNCTKSSTTTQLFIGFHSSLMCCTYCESAKSPIFNKNDQDFVCFMLITSMFVPNLELIGSSSRIKDAKYHFFPKKWQQNHALTHLSEKTWTLLLGRFCAHLKSSDKREL